MKVTQYKNFNNFWRNVQSPSSISKVKNQESQHECNNCTLQSPKLGLLVFDFWDSQVEGPESDLCTAKLAECNYCTHSGVPNIGRPTYEMSIFN